jgi:hypothetical protein
MLPVAFPYFSEQNGGNRLREFERVFRRHQEMADALDAPHKLSGQASLF